MAKTAQIELGKYVFTATQGKKDVCLSCEIDGSETIILGVTGAGYDSLHEALFFAGMWVGKKEAAK